LGVAPYIAPAIKASVIAGYTAGKSLRKLAIEFRLGRPTVTKIVNRFQPERVVKLSVDQFKELIDAALESYQFVLREELDGKRAAEF
jgi:transposase